MRSRARQCWRRCKGSPAAIQANYRQRLATDFTVVCLSSIVVFPDAAASGRVVLASGGPGVRNDGCAPLSEWSGRVDVPTGYAVYPYELLRTPRAWAAARYDLVHYAIQERGGHFAAFERPAAFAADLANFADVLTEQGVF